MKMKGFLLLVLALFLIMSMMPAEAAAQEEGPVVHVVFFYSPSCPHCHTVLEEVFPPLVDQYGDSLQILQIDVTQRTGQTLYQTAVNTFQIPQERLGVPTLIVDDVVLVGSREIPAQFPGLIEEGLAAGGVGWPTIPGLDRAYPDVVATGAEVEASTPVNATPFDPAARESAADPVGAVLAALLFLVMLGALAYTVLQIMNSRFLDASFAPMRGWTVPALIFSGLLVALYLSYVELTQVEAVCGPVGDCNAVQSSAYATIVGIPVAALGVANFLVLGVLWMGQRLLDNRWMRLSTLAMVALTIAGTLFSIYLTVLELFVIEAVCAWCLASAAVTTALMVTTVQFAVREGRPLRRKGRRMRRLDT